MGLGSHAFAEVLQHRQEGGMQHIISRSSSDPKETLHAHRQKSVLSWAKQCDCETILFGYATDDTPLRCFEHCAKERASPMENMRRALFESDSKDISGELRDRFRFSPHAQRHGI